ncbi:MAG: hypothetical protein P4K80_09180, partial [Acidobacteriaceae bacterium]|nr:hypothetical protein [Acidobacteriaceae bacterium]
YNGLANRRLQPLGQLSCPPRNFAEANAGLNYNYRVVLPLRADVECSGSVFFALKFPSGNIFLLSNTNH